MTSTKSQRPGCLAFLFGSGKSRVINTSESDESISQSFTGPLPYRMRDDFLSKAEFSFYRVLSSVVGAQVAVCVKVRLGDIFFVMRPHENVGYRNRIRSKHIDYLLCDATTMKPLFAIELDDRSHRRPDRKERDEFVDKVFQTAGLPLIRIAARREYSPREIAAQIARALAGKVSIPSVIAALDTPASPKNTSELGEPAPLCPKCGIPMVVRKATQGSNKGGQFYGCQNYPRCHQILPFQQSKPTE